MAVPFDPTDPAHFTPEQRLDELAAILAAGVRRALALRATPVPASPELPAECARDGLDPSRVQSVHGPRG
jgi:hypothetical protein